MVLATLRASDFSEIERPEWAKSSYPPEPTTEANAEILGLTQEIADLKGTIEALGKAVQLNSKESPPDVGQNLPRGIQRGERCAQIIEEMRHLKHWVLGGKTMAEVQAENPTLHVWKFRETLTTADREHFDHPNRWAPVTGYAHALLGKDYGRSPVTIRDWVKAHRREARQKSATS